VDRCPRWPDAAIVVAIAILYLLAMPAARAAVNLNQHGLTGSWYEPATSGQGIELEVFPDLIAPGTGYLQGSWFTFDHAASGGGGHGRWYTFGGSVSDGSGTASFPLYRNVGGNFAAPPVTQAEQVGTVSLAFVDCTSATLTYAFTDGTGRTGSVALSRLMPNVTCAPGGSAPPDAAFGYSGNWFDPALSGQGLVLEVNPAANAMFLAWYTYAVGGQAQGAAGQRWFTGQAGYAPGMQVASLALYETTGGRFDIRPPDPRTVQVGSATLTFAGCGAAHFAYAFDGGSNAGRSGELNLSRVGPVPAGCGWTGSDAQGVWKGLSASGRAITAIVLNDGTYYLAYTEPGSGSVIGALQGSSIAGNGVFASGSGRNVAFTTRMAGGSSTVAGRYVRATSLQVEIGAGASAETVTAAYDAGYDQPASLATLAGTYAGQGGHRGESAATWLTFAADGSTSFLGLECTFTAVALPHGATGLFDFTLRAIDGPCVGGGLRQATGILQLDLAAGAFVAMVPFRNTLLGIDDIYILRGARP
jgi:hypothetical protein